MSYDIGIQIQKYRRTDQLLGSEPFPFVNWISNDNTYINKPYKILHRLSSTQKDLILSQK